MKITRLSSTEVINTSALPSELKRSHLLGVETPKVFWNYKPVQEALPALLLASFGLFGRFPEGDHLKTINAIRRSCRSGAAQETACVAVSEAIIDWRKRNDVKGRVVQHEPLRTTVDTLSYCCDVVAIYQDKPYVLYFDPRSQMKLSFEAKEMMKSLIHHTALVGDLRDAGVGILSTPSVAKGVRKCRFETLTGEPKYTLDEILASIVETYAIWQTILSDRAAGRDAREA